MPDPGDTRKLLRFPELYRREGPLIICPIDDTLISGPVAGLENPYDKLKAMIAGRPSAILTFSGMVERNPSSFIGQRYIINLSASTSRSSYTRKVLLGSVETALSFHASAVAVHINLASEYANEMIAAGGGIIEQARRYGIPTVGIMYPRGELDGEPEEFLALKAEAPERYAELVGHCVQVGVDMGFDLIKTQYTGSENTFRRVIAAAGPVPVVVAGGPLIEESAAIENARGAVRAGAAGISFARNVFGRQKPDLFIEQVRAALVNIVS
jgi:DhnA family fructose-bisphosphate aldolase class Ia